MATAAATATTAASAPRPWWRGKIGLVVAIVLVIVISYIGWKGDYPWPSWLTWGALNGYLDNFQNWLSAKRNVANPSFFFTIFNGFATFLDNLVTWITHFFFRLTWVGTAAFGIVVVLRFGSRWAALGVAAAFASFALMGLWLESVQTFALMTAAVSLSLLIGMPLGVLAGRSDRFLRAVTPILDAMQIVPAFAYLMPVVILFSVGPGAAVVTTMIYAIPPAIRITALGIRGVATNTVEAAEALGSTKRQVLTKVQLPLARRMLLLSVNQVILFALSMVVIAGLIGGPGLGNVVTSGIYSNPALAILAGFAIVIMAIALDRSTESMALRTDPTHRHVTEEVRRRLHLQTLAAVGTVGLAVGLGYAFGAGAVYSDPNRQTWLLARIQSVLDYIQNPATVVFGISSPIGNFMVKYGLEPINSYAAGTPWFVMALGLTAIAFVAQRTAAGYHNARRARLNRGDGPVGSRNGDGRAGARRHGPRRRVRDPARSLGGGEPDRGEDPPPHQRRAADAAAARLHHPVHLPDAGLHRARDHRRGAVRDPGRDQARLGRRP